MTEPITAYYQRHLHIAGVADRLAARLPWNYARSAAPLSPYTGLTANYRPGRTPLNWLKGFYKCNQFVGDVLTLAGFRMPTYRMRDGTEHYLNAEALLRAQNSFYRVTEWRFAMPGDLVLFDWAKRGLNGAHVEVISEIDTQRPRLITIGAHAEGAGKRDFSYLLKTSYLDPKIAGWRHQSKQRESFEIYVLRPIG